MNNEKKAPVRQIKFRGLRVDGKGLVYGDLLTGVGYYKKGRFYILPTVENLASIEGCHPLDGLEVIPETVGQFTGLLDKNGKEIYEGDCVLILYTDWPSNTDNNVSLEDYMDSLSKKGTVVFSENSWNLEMIDRYDESYLSSIEPGSHGRIKVIGNIHEETKGNV